MQCCGAGPFLTDSGYFFHQLRLRLQLIVGFDLVKKYFFNILVPTSLQEKFFLSLCHYLIFN